MEARIIKLFCTLLFAASYVAASQPPATHSRSFTKAEVEMLRPLLSEWRQRDAALRIAQAEFDAADARLGAHFWRVLAKRGLDPDQWQPTGDWSGIEPKPQLKAPDAAPNATDPNQKGAEQKPK